MDLRPGDLFATNGRGFLAASIRAVEWFWSTDNSAPYNHLGFVVDAKGRTLEARWRFKFYDLANYIGSKVYIVRHKDMTPERFAAGFRAVSGDIGCLYPAWRLFPFIFHLAKFFRFGPGVCSEQTGKFLKGAGFKNIVYGLTPDDYVDKWKSDKDIETIFEGLLIEEILNKLKEGVL
jgi:hypothetical protein